ncbi:MAG: DUF421 domain-containing protein [Bacilli bacterium]|nr:DUF421 domain-containing protein [Bacilli bacterium]MCI9433973.1 DUF421 domain-containing protein [Bacilli bacterium]
MYFEIIFKTALLYFIIILAYRIMGKKEVGELSIVDLIVSLLIAELAAISIEDIDVSVFRSIVPIAVLVIIQVVLSYISLKNTKFRKSVEGSPTVIIKEGKLKFNEMSKLRYSLDDLITQLREQGIKSIEEVSYAVLENDGKLSVFQNTVDYPMPIIMDGVINKEVLKDMKKSSDWVMKILKNKKLNLEDVFYAFHTKEKTFIIKKNDLL